MKRPKEQGLAQDYLIFHPARKPFEATGTARVACRAPAAWAGRVWADRTTALWSGNEDPFIWTDFWLYSYCHATQLRRKAQAPPFVQRGSRLFFCEAEAAKTGCLKVDTVFKVAHDLPWEPPGDVPGAFLYLDQDGPEWRRHLRHGTKLPGSYGAHMGRFTYVAQMNGASFLPMDSECVAASIASARVSRRLRAAVIAANPVGRGSYPVATDEDEADLLYGELSGSYVCVTSVNPDGHPVAL